MPKSITTNKDNSRTFSQNGNESTDTNSDSYVPSSGTPQDTASSSPKCNTSNAATPDDVVNDNAEVNGIIGKDTLKAASSLDPSVLCRGSSAYEKYSFDQQKKKLNSPSKTNEHKKVCNNKNIAESYTVYNTNNPNIISLKESLRHELSREEECLC